MKVGDLVKLNPDVFKMDSAYWCCYKSYPSRSVLR